MISFYKFIFEFLRSHLSLTIYRLFSSRYLCIALFLLPAYHPAHGHLGVIVMNKSKVILYPYPCRRYCIISHPWGRGRPSSGRGNHLNELLVFKITSITTSSSSEQILLPSVDKNILRSESGLHSRLSHKCLSIFLR